MKQLVECVPNFSEGRDKSVIDGITAAITSVEGIKLLNVDMGYDTNRTVVTFAGPPEVIVEASFRGVKASSELIDMKIQKGEHPRMGGADVFPLIPLSGISVEECLPLADELAARLGNELSIPVYMYAHSARSEDRRRLPDIRDGEYEGMKRKMEEGFKPDFGPDEFNPDTGVTAVGVRDFLLAYNVNLSTWDRKIASDIALTVREKGRAKRDRKGEIIRDVNGNAEKVPGRLAACQAAGWYMEEYGYAQVTMNLTSFKKTGLHHAFTVVSEEAAKRGARVTGSEAIGLLPREAVLDAGKFFLEKMGKNTGIPEKDIIRAAVLGLGLEDTSPFYPEKRIIEYAVQGPVAGMKNLKLTDFCDELSSDSVAPGGGSVSALSGALSASLGSMVANITFIKSSSASDRKKMKDLSVRLQEIKKRMLDLIQEDTDAFNSYLAALRLKKTVSLLEESERKRAVSEAARRVTLVPLETLRLSLEVMEIAEKVLKKGINSALSDSFSAIAQAYAAARGASMNVRINIPLVKEHSTAESIREESSELMDRAAGMYKRLLRYVEKQI